MIARYRIEVTPAARRALESFPKKILKQIDKRILALADDPYPPGSKKLQDTADLRRIPVGDYRIVYIVEAERLVIVIVAVGHRREIYR
ncbi:MAG: type II toxin-antitoxin system RelE/ParE family toxin [candidate division NC10 bacterium]|jgi:mRNA interferase RelE/StbE